MIFPSEAAAARCCADYQRVLRLQDWRVRVRIVPANEIDGRSQAQVHWQLARRMAVVKLMAPADYALRYEEPQDHELDLVHELCHLHLLGLNVAADTPEDMAQEQAIEALSEAIVSATRAARAA